jgi:hypothetical protein
MIDDRSEPRCEVTHTFKAGVEWKDQGVALELCCRMPEPSANPAVFVSADVPLEVGCSDVCVTLRPS